MYEQKLIIVGDEGVGKTSFVKRLMNVNIDDNYVPTLGIANTDYHKNNYKFHIWDTGGKYKGLADGYYPGADCAIIMMSDNLKLKNVKHYVGNIIRKCGRIPILFVCNKCELPNTMLNYNRIVNEVKNVMYCSAKENININETIDKLIEML